MELFFGSGEFFEIWEFLRFFWKFWRNEMSVYAPIVYNNEERREKREARSERQLQRPARRSGEREELVGEECQKRDAE